MRGKRSRIGSKGSIPQGSREHTYIIPSASEAGYLRIVPPKSIMDEGWNNERRPSQIYHPSHSNPGSFEGGPVSATTPSESKVPIPRLQRPAQTKTSVPGERQRVSHACEPCRRRKSKCDGAQPICSRCRDHELVCSYTDGKRERLKR